MKRMMFLKRMVAMMAIVFSVVMFAACSDDDEGTGSNAVTSVTLDQESLTLSIGDTITLWATVMPDEATDKTLEWVSSDENVATVTDGFVTAIGVGSAEITVTAKGGKDVSATCPITVTAEEATPKVGDLFYGDGTFGSEFTAEHGKVLGVVFYIGDVTDVNPSLKTLFPNGTKGLVVSAGTDEQKWWSRTFDQYSWSFDWVTGGLVQVEHVLIDWLAENYKDADVLNEEALNGYENTCAYAAWNAYAKEEGLEVEQWGETESEILPVIVEVLEDLNAFRSGTYKTSDITIPVSDWYIPSVGELKKIAENFEVVNESLQYGIQISIDDKDTSGTTRYWSSTIGEKDPTTGMTNDVAWSYSFGERTPYCEGANSQYSLKYVLAF